LALTSGTKDLQEIQGALVAAPGTGALLLLGGLALAGVPPFGMFSSEFVILSAGFSRANGVAAGLLLIALALAFGALLWHLSRMLLGSPRHPYAQGTRTAVGASFGLGVVLAVALGLGLLLPDPLSQLLHGAVRVVSG
jgi:hydrogenase-4 component F